MRLFGLVLLFLAPAFAGEFAVLSTGAKLHADRHEAAEGGKIRLYNGEGYIELPGSMVSGFETEEAPSTTPAETPAPLAAAAQSPRQSPQELADAAADKYGLPRSLVRSVMAAESANQTNAVSPKGAIGLMQLMPGTAQTLNANPYDPVQNTDAGARYLRDLLIKYDGRLWHALAAYNAGPQAVEKYNGVPPYRETENYVKRIDAKYKQALVSEKSGKKPATAPATAESVKPAPTAASTGN